MCEIKTRLVEMSNMSLDEGLISKPISMSDVPGCVLICDSVRSIGVCRSLLRLISKNNTGF